MNRLRMAVIGTGALGQHHARILSGLPDVELVAVADSREETGRRVAEKCQARWVADYRDLLGDVDAVTIAVPTSQHFPVASEFLRRGIATLVEKPLALNSDEGRILVKLAEKYEAPLQVGHIERFNAATQTAVPYCRNPKYIRCERLSPYPFRSLDIGVVHDVMIHDLDLVLLLADAPLERVEAFGIGMMGGGHEDAVQARLYFESGCIADLTASRINPEQKRAMQVWGELGCVNIDFVKSEVTLHAPTEELRTGTSPYELAQQPGADLVALRQDVFGRFIEIKPLLVTPHDNLTVELTSFVECVRDHSRPVVDGEAGLRALSVAGRVVDCVARHQWNGHAAGPVGPQFRLPNLRKVG